MKEHRAADAGLYDRVAKDAARVVIRRYSTSFGLASRLLRVPVRGQVQNIYALVRLADEIVDGAAAAAGVPATAIPQLLNDVERETERALEQGYSTNPIIHAFAVTAREVGIGVDLTRPFFRSMRTDLTQDQHDADSFADYVYGSAEVVGLMCLQSFLHGTDITAERRKRLISGARRLGAAFQKVNFLRDLADDAEHLGRSYFPGLDIETFSETDKHRLLDDIESDLRAAADVIPELPGSSRRAVAVAHGLFAELARRLRATPATKLTGARVRVPNPIKLKLAATAVLMTSVPSAATREEGRS